jgi:uncharacterized protein YhaN
MKINIFKLLAYGPFTDKILDFSGNGFGLHIVFGPNEAGKSTALRALIGLFYGFGHIVEDAWFGALEKYVKANAPLPFIVDDVLVHFDDERAAAALSALGELSKETQVVFFTHHKHLVNLAESFVSDKMLRVHEL